MKKNNKVIIGLIIGVIAIGSAYGYYQSTKVKLTEVKAALVDKGDIESILSTSGAIKSENRRDYYGNQLTVKKVNVRVGDRVAAGTELVSFETADLEAAVEQAKLSKNSASIQLSEAEKAITSAKKQKSDLDAQINRTSAELKAVSERMAYLKNNPTPEGIIELIELNQKVTILTETLQSLNTAKISIPAVSDGQVNLLRNTVATADLAVRTAQNRLAVTGGSIKAPFDGVVTYLNANEGQTASIQNLLITIMDDKNIRIELALGKIDSEKIVLGQSAKIKFSGREYAGSVSFVSPAASSSITGLASSLTTGGGDATLSAYIRVEQPEKLTIDFDADVEILLEKKQGVTRIPIEALIYEKGGVTKVFTISEEGIVKPEYVTTGIFSPTFVEVTEGLKAGEKIILSPSQDLKDGEKVKVID
ncbi:MAG: HlyD family efflux transporter periplasmic adaptor subunit [Eubacteriaceae bacterium]|nr:HlyD family efflux transporter periplasmic adaptor subunit [Eubacteriaceae bacterium]